jgi:hypothetical protein
MIPCVVNIIRIHENATKELGFRYIATIELVQCDRRQDFRPIVLRSSSLIGLAGELRVIKELNWGDVEGHLQSSGAYRHQTHIDEESCMKFPMVL